MAAYWEKAAHSAYDMSFVYVSDCYFSFFPTSVFGMGISF